MGYHILAVDDEKEIIKLLKLYLERDELTLYEAYDGKEALTVLEERTIDLLIVDILMPEIGGFELIKRVRKNSNIPIIVISACVDSSDRIFGLELGADDYIIKPFDPLEVVARVKALLRRYNTLGSNIGLDTAHISVGSLKLDTHSCTVRTEAEDEIELSAVEFRVLKLLMENPGRVFTREQIFEQGWKDEIVSDNSIRVMMSKLRDKIGPERIKTIRGLGYRLEKNHEGA
ncbi:response regulator transcription factor [Enterococcus sp. BWR-S5]|uniref:response regulator transcription factor n=1 Tax=Enterococcus sp. BWR-S5 TaxID=2787714 RepID=UPI00192348A1|nr:response regulator transcription factor [Enterococcus sp. BWR-S5]MBL1227307.1 response regulator transcription factor [Enterococcus sp. BWR-S5]